ncbi:hypothetical protein [Streptomyces sp. NPDC018055]|uniref:hypothetical protein n=1 Tax=Streptomyces sp. NPDC018055 TaxID=3365038 RepID=UPI00379488E4
MSSSVSISSEKPPVLTATNDVYTLPVSLAAELLGREESMVHRLVELSRSNAKNNIAGPLELADGGQSVTLKSVLNYRSKLTLPSA